MFACFLLCENVGNFNVFCVYVFTIQTISFVVDEIGGYVLYLYTLRIHIPICQCLCWLLLCCIHNYTYDIGHRTYGILEEEWKSEIFWFKTLKTTTNAQRYSRIVRHKTQTISFEYFDFHFLETSFCYPVDMCGVLHSIERKTFKRKAWNA